MVEPHGGKLVNRVLSEAERIRTEQSAASRKRLVVPRETLQDAENLARGVFSPLEGFLPQHELRSVLQRGRLTDGTPWTVPLVLDAPEPEAQGLRPGDRVNLLDSGGALHSVLEVEEVYRLERDEYARNVFGTLDSRHPGVQRVAAMGEYLIAGPVDLVRPLENRFERFTLWPAETRILFQNRGWRTVAGFQTRNVPHAGHEDLHKTVLGLVDGLLIQPIIGRKKKGDFRDEVILEGYEILLKNYYAASRIALAILPTEMRYAGPREAIFHAIIRKNYGCTHFIVGRDHAGVGKFYPENAAIEIFNEFPDLAVQPIAIHGDFFYCTRCRRISSERACPHGSTHAIPFSGTEIRDSLRSGGTPVPEVMRPEVFGVLQKAAQPFVE